MSALEDVVGASRIVPPARESRRAVFVAVPALAGDGAQDAVSPAQVERRATQRRLRDAALGAALASAPMVFASFIVAAASGSLLLDASPWREAWMGAAALVALAWVALAWVAQRRRPLIRDTRLKRHTVAAIGIATMLVVAAMPWLPPPMQPALERGLLMLSVGAVALASASAFAAIRLPVSVAIALPLSPALAEWLRIAAPPAITPRLWIAGVFLSVATGLIALAQQRWWLRRARQAIELEDHMRHLEARCDAALRADEEKSRFLAIASHDLRQPVHALGLFAATLEKRLQGTSDEPLARNVVRSIDGLDRSFNAMLDISRLDAGTMEPNLQHIPLRDLFRRLHMHFADQAEMSGLGLRFSPGGKSVTSDPQLLERILGNLIQNAIKYTESGGIVVVARTTATQCNLEVWDTGEGIGAAELPRVFDEFYRVGRGQRSRAQGLGMGLAIVKRLARLLGHRLSVSSQPGRGTMFRIGIAQRALPESQDVMAPTDAWPMPVLQPRTVLVIDDEEAIRDGLRLLLEEWGYRALIADSLDEALRIVRVLALPPDLILSDLHLAEGPDGIAAIDAVRRDCGCEPPAILITGDTSREEMRRATDSGHPVLVKPVQARKLLNTMRGLVS